MDNTSLFDEKTFYQTLLRDLNHCKNEVIIESPFITTKRMKTFDRVFKNLVQRGVKIYIVTRDPLEHDYGYEVQSEDAIRWCEEIGIQVLLCSGNHHRKLAIIDRKLLWVGSLNILSQSNSREIMIRDDNQDAALKVLRFSNIGKFI